jgi:hypothetical protein
MSDDERIDFFFDRLKADPTLGTLAIILAPYRAMARDPAGLVATLDALAAHWAAANNAATMEAEAL